MPVFASTTASGGGAGTLGDPYTLKEAAVNVNGQDTIFCRGGKYTGVRGIGGAATETFGVLASGSGSNYTTIMPYDNEPVEFEALENVNIMIRMPTDLQRVRFQNITFTGKFTGTTQTSFLSGQSGDSASHIDIQSCIIQGFSYVTIQTSATPNLRVLDTTFRNLFGSPAGAYGIYVNGGSDNCEIARCLFDTISEQCIQHFSSSGEASNCSYHDNTFTNWASGGAGNTPAVFMTNGENNLFYNNILYNGGSNSVGAIQVEFGAGGDLRSSIFAHNAIYNPGGFCFRFGQTASVANTILNNIGIGGTSFVSSDGDQTPTQTTNLWQVAPTATAANTWVNPGVDFHLKTGSAAINAGTYSATFPTGRDGATRANPPDIGPYEFGASLTPTNIIPASLVTQVNVSISFEDFSVSHGGDLDRIIIYPQSGTIG